MIPRDGFGCDPVSETCGVPWNDFSSRNDDRQGFDRDHGADNGREMATVFYGNWGCGNVSENGKIDDDRGIGNGDAVAGFESANETGGYLQGRPSLRRPDYAL